VNQFPWGVITILGIGLIFTTYIIYYILKLAYLEMKDEASESGSINHKPKH
jgi:hypothetical protein